MLICIKKKFWCFNFPRSLASLSKLLIRLTIWFKWVSRLIFSFSTEAKLRPLESNLVSRHSRSCFFPSFALSLYLKKNQIYCMQIKEGCNWGHGLSAAIKILMAAEWADKPCPQLQPSLISTTNETFLYSIKNCFNMNSWGFEFIERCIILKKKCEIKDLCWLVVGYAVVM